jgi:tetratricopeptide (TPR) repeat protein
LVRLRDSGKHLDALELLKNHPFFVDRSRLAFFRGYLLDCLGKHDAAAQFYKKLIEFSGDLPASLAFASGYTATMMIANQFDTSADYIRAQTTVLGNPVTYLCAAALTRGMAEQENNPQRRRELIADFHTYFQSGKEGFLKLPPKFQNSPELRSKLEAVTAAEIVYFIEEREWNKTEASLQHALAAFPDSTLFKEIQKRLPDEIQAHNSILNFYNFLMKRNHEDAERVRSWSRTDNLAA